MTYIRRLEDMGVIREKLRVVLQSDLFNVSKHDPKWESEYEREADLLEDARLQAAYLRDELWEMYMIANNQDMDEDA